MPDHSAQRSAAAATGSPPDATSLVVVGSADSCADLMVHPGLEHADVILVDLPGLDQEVAPLIERLLHQSGIKLLVLAVARDVEPVRHAVLRATDRGAPGSAAASRMAPPTALDDDARPHPPRRTALLRRHASSAATDPAVRREDAALRHHGLTAKEREVIRQMVRHRGTKNHAIAQELGISEHTLRNHLTVIYSKLGVQGKLNLYVYALEHGLAPADAALPAGAMRWRPGDPDRRVHRAIA